MADGRYRAFAATVELQSLTKAAEQLGYTQSGVSHLINALENEMGFPLLVRSRAGVYPTEEGRAILPYIRRLLSAADDIGHKADDIRGLTSGTVRIGTFSSVAIQWLPKLLHSFAQAHPGVSTEITNDTYSVLETELVEDRVDCAFVTLPSRREFDVTLLRRERLMAILPMEHPLAARERLTPDDLKDEPFIVPAEGTNYDIGKLFTQAGIAPSIRFDMSDDYAAVAMVRQNLGYTILAELMVYDLPMERLAVVPLVGSAREIGIAVNRDRYLSPAAKAFVSHVRSVFSAEIPDDT